MARAGARALGGHCPPRASGARGHQAPLQAGAAAQTWCPLPGQCCPVAQILLIYLAASLEHPELSHGGCTMTRFLLSIVLGVGTVLGLLLPLPPSEAAVVAKTLVQTPVTGRLADGGTFQGWLTLQALRFDEDGQIVATGVLSGTATPAVGRTTKVPAHTFTTPVALLDLRGTCRTLVVDLAPLTVAPLVQELTLVPVVLAPEAAPKEERRLQMALCTVARLQE